MNKKGMMVNIIAGIVVLMVGLLIMYVIVWEMYSNKYVTNQQTSCEDRDGDMIADQVCYKKIECMPFLTFLNQEGCNEFVGGKE